MTLIKVCPNCLRSYPDISLNFCTDDRAALSQSLEILNFAAFPDPNRDGCLDRQFGLSDQRKFVCLRVDDHVVPVSECDSFKFEPAERCDIPFE